MQRSSYLHSPRAQNATLPPFAVAQPLQQLLLIPEPLLQLRLVDPQTVEFGPAMATELAQHLRGAHPPSIALQIDAYSRRCALHARRIVLPPYCRSVHAVCTYAILVGHPGVTPVVVFYVVKRPVLLAPVVVSLVVAPAQFHQSPTPVLQTG